MNISQIAKALNTKKREWWHHIIYCLIIVTVFALWKMITTSQQIKNIFKAISWTSESLGLEEIQPVHPKGDQSWVIIGRTAVEAETPILWPPDAKHWLIWKESDAGKDWGQQKGTTEDEMVGWHHQLNGHGFGWTPGVGDGRGGLGCCGSWSRKESDTTERLNWTNSPERPLQALTPHAMHMD